MTTYEIWSLIVSVITLLVGIAIGYFQISISQSLHPNLQGKIQQMWDGNINNSNVQGLIISATISNLGSPTVVGAYRLEVTLAGENSSTIYKPSVLPEKINGKNPASFGSADAIALFDKTVRPIAGGDQAVGWLFFTLLDVKGEKLHAPGTKLVLLFEDVKGKLYRSEERFFSGKNDGSFSYLPGAGKPFG